LANDIKLILENNMKKRFLPLYFLAILILFPSIASYSQQLTAEYEKVYNPFVSYAEPIDIAILKIEGGDNLESILSDAMMKDEKILKRFNIYPFSLLEENKEVLGLKKLQADDPKTQKALLEKFRIKFIVAGTAVSNNEFSLTLINGQNGRVEYTAEFKNSINSSATKDVIKFFAENMGTIYTSKGSVVINVTPADAVIQIDNNSYQNGKEVILKIGSHEIKIKKDGYADVDETFLITSGQRTEKSYTLSESIGWLNLTVTPSDAIVKLMKGSEIVQTWTGGQTGYEIKPGKYTMEVVKTDYLKQSKEITITAGIVNDVAINLEAQKIPGFQKNEIVAEASLVRNARIEENKSNYVIRYDLNGDIEKEYEVKIYLMDKSNVNYEYELKMIKGDVGKGKYAGRDRSAVWNYKDEFTGGIENDNLYLKITAEKIGGGIPWYVWAGGALAGGAAAVLLGGKKDSGGGGSTTVTIPTPPLRPSN
jgi:hypothetical protein